MQLQIIFLWIKLQKIKSENKVCLYVKIYNLSISRGVFLDACKIAKLKPIYKKGKKTDLFNYRPISLLPIISNVIERTVNDQTNKFLSENNILYNFQSGFWPNYSTNLCLTYLTDKMLKGFDEGLLTGMVVIDLQKGFFTINHDVLLQKLKAIWFSEQSIQWFRFHICERIFLIETENKLSDFWRISCGVPRGFILGQLLFLIYVNDTPQAVKSNLLLYADDSSYVPT